MKKGDAGKNSRNKIITTSIIVIFIVLVMIGVGAAFNWKINGNVVFNGIISELFGEDVYLAPPPPCTETDGGNRPYIAGTVTQSGITYNDVCNSATQVKEYFCAGPNVQNNNFNCPDGCQATACKLNAPSGLTGSVSGNTVSLSWTDNSNAEDGFRIERSSTSATSGFSVLATVGININSATDSVTTPGTYYYKIAAYKGGTLSTYSNVYIATVGQVNAYCVDGDGTLPLIEQTNKSSLVVYLFDECNTQTVQAGNEECYYTISAADVCLNSSVLAEQRCFGTIHNYTLVNCAGNCSQGRCE